MRTLTDITLARFQDEILAAIRLEEGVDTLTILKDGTELAGFKRIADFLTAPKNIATPASEVRRILLNSDRVKNGQFVLKDGGSKPIAERSGTKSAAGASASSGFSGNEDLAAILLSLAEEKGLADVFKRPELLGRACTPDTVAKYLSLVDCREQNLRRFLFLVAFLLDAALSDLERLLRSGMQAQVNYRDMQECIFAMFLTSGFSYSEAEDAFKRYRNAVAQHTKDARDSQCKLLQSRDDRSPKDVLRFLLETTVTTTTSIQYFGDSSRYNGKKNYKNTRTALDAWAKKKNLTLDSLFQRHAEECKKKMTIKNAEEKGFSRIDLVNLSHVLRLNQSEIDAFFSDMGAACLDVFNRSEAAAYYCLTHYEGVYAWYKDEVTTPSPHNLAERLLQEAYTQDVIDTNAEGDNDDLKSCDTLAVMAQAVAAFDNTKDANAWLDSQVINWTRYTGTSRTLLRQYHALLEGFSFSYRGTMSHEIDDLADTIIDNAVDEEYIETAETLLDLSSDFLRSFHVTGSREYIDFRDKLLFGLGGNKTEQYKRETDESRTLSNVRQAVARVREAKDDTTDSGIKDRAEALAKKKAAVIAETAPRKATQKCIPFAAGLLRENEADLPSASESVSLEDRAAAYLNAVKGPIGSLLQYIPKEFSYRPIAKKDSKAFPRVQRILSEMVQPTRCDFLFLAFLEYCDTIEYSDDRSLLRGLDSGKINVLDIVERFNAFAAKKYPDILDLSLYIRCPFDALILTCLCCENPMAMLLTLLDYNSNMDRSFTGAAK